MLDVEPLPSYYPINVDFLPELGLQTVWDGDRHLFKMILNIGAVIGSETERSKIGELTIIDRNTALKTTTIQVGGTPNDIDITQKEVYKQILDAAGEVDRITIKERGMIHKIPNKLHELPAFQSAECLYHFENSLGNYTNMMRKRTSYPLFDVNYMIKTELIERIRKSYKLRRMGININKLFLRSTLRTTWLVDNEHLGLQGWRAFLYDSDEGKLFLDTLRTIKDGIWFKDTAIPKINIIALDGRSVEAVLYELDNRPGEIIG
jgi:hypothetical protein